MEEVESLLQRIPSWKVTAVLFRMGVAERYASPNHPSVAIKSLDNDFADLFDLLRTQPITNMHFGK